MAYLYEGDAVEEGYAQTEQYDYGPETASELAENLRQDELAPVVLLGKVDFGTFQALQLGAKIDIVERLLKECAQPEVDALDITGKHPALDFGLNMTQF